MKTGTIGDILFNEQQVARAIELFRTCRAGTFAKTICDELIQPQITEIDERLGQQNDPLYLAYVIEHAITQATTPTQESRTFGRN